jgi:hypothetical protein
MTYSFLTVLGSLPSNGRHRRVEAKCECGNIKSFRLAHLISGSTKSCGCRKISSQREKMTKHGSYVSGRISKEMSAYQAMLTRCYNDKAPMFHNYGGRGVLVCDRWLSGNGERSGFECFRDDLGLAPSKSHSLDRIEVNGKYEPSNCRWATPKEQANNRRNNVFLEAFGVKKSLCAWAEEIGICPESLQFRIKKKGWTVEKAVSTPKLKHTKRRILV